MRLHPFDRPVLLSKKIGPIMLLAALGLAVPTLPHALAQSLPAPAQAVGPQPAGPASATSPFLSAEPAETFRMTRIIGATVLGSTGELLGVVDDLLFDGNGQVQTAVIGLAGFLELGEKDVAMPFRSLSVVGPLPAGQPMSEPFRDGKYGGSSPQQVMIAATVQDLAAAPPYKAGAGRALSVRHPRVPAYRKWSPRNRSPAPNPAAQAEPPLFREGSMSDQNLNRRQLLAGAAVSVATGHATAPAEARTIKGEMPWAPAVADAPAAFVPGSYQFFTPDEATFIEAVVSRLIPADDLGPGAKEVGVPTFLDRQLAGPYGQAERWYMLGPWRAGTDMQGYQSRLTPAQLYRFAIKAIEGVVRDQNQGRFFAQLPPEEQDRFLEALEKVDVELQGVSAKVFFDMLLQNTVEGFFADPIYGGNRNMAAWKMIGFPGARYDYRDFVGKHGERYPLPPVSLQGRPQWNPNG